jgi:FMN phosphatase YigB (HAD superfamily)
MRDKIVFFDIDYTLFNTDSFKKSGLTQHKNYDEVESILKLVSEEALLGVFSEGDREFQLEKLKKTQIYKYFSPEYIFIVESKVDELKTLLEIKNKSRIFFVDDRLSILSDIKKILPEALVIWVKRGIYAKENKVLDFLPDYSIDNLETLQDIIKAN